MSVPTACVRICGAATGASATWATRQARLAGSVRVSVPAGRARVRGPLLLRRPHLAPLPALQTWTSVPSTASCATTGGARTALAATAAPVPRVSASGRTRRPAKVQGLRHTAWGVYMHTHTHILCVVCTHRCTHSDAHAACSVHTHAHAQTLLPAMCTHTRAQRCVSIYT